MRPLYLAGWGYAAIAAVLIYRAAPSVDVAPVYNGLRPPVVEQLPAATAAQWFATVKPQCNALEAELTMTRSPAPAGEEGAGFAAACYALAGKTTRAQQLIDALPVSEQSRAAGIVFEVVHPVADAGDDESAGPMMELVLRYLPDHYMALYHAGIAEYRTGRRDLAIKNLEAFLRHYHQDDGWTGSAESVLKELRGTR
jgi:thioredoxin-like negative regulator of GroEL